MQHLLEFLYEHSFDKQLYCVVPSARGELQLTWRAKAPLRWEIRRAGEAAFEERPRGDLLAYLSEQGADLASFEHELNALVAAHVVVADQLLSAARRALGGDMVSAMLRGHDSFVHDLQQALRASAPPRLRLVR
jgi:hypothetical protein